MSRYAEEPPYRDPGGGGLPHLALPRPGPAVKALLILNFGMFLGIWLLGWVGGLRAVQWIFTDLLSLRSDLWASWFPLVPFWQLVTSGFVHSPESLGHILGNMLGLYFFGTMLEDTVGTRRFLVVYVTAIVLGSVLALAWSLLPGPPRIVFGASGAVLAVVVAMAVLRPNQLVIVLFIPLTLKWLAVIFVGLDLFAILSPGSDGVAHEVHLAGAAWGFLAARRGWIWRDPLETWAARRDAAAVEREVSDQERLDELLDRIHREGMSSLSRRDREFLRRVSSRR